MTREQLCQCEAKDVDSFYVSDDNSEACLNCGLWITPKCPEDDNCHWCDNRPAKPDLKDGFPKYCVAFKILINFYKGDGLQIGKIVEGHGIHKGNPNAIIASPISGPSRGQELLFAEVELEAMTEAAEDMMDLVKE